MSFVHAGFLAKVSDPFPFPDLIIDDPRIILFSDEELNFGSKTSVRDDDNFML